METVAEFLIDRQFDTAVLFGYDSLSHFVVSGFNSLAALSPTGAKPFDAGRNGLTLGEGAAMAVVSYRAIKTGDLFVAGAGSSNDANHRTGPSRDGSGLHRAAAAALDNAKLVPRQIGAVKCHGTATSYNDAMEAKALVRTFGGAIPPCVSFKGAIGHTSGASSLVELGMALACLKKKTVPPTAGFSARGVDEPIPVSRAVQQYDAPYLLCLCAGFGGVNAAIVVGESQ
jgi:3-oxoacyl-(acyl-carrier-protein) synthase